MFIITKDTKEYLTKVVEDKIGGFPIVIQLWKGWCERLGGRYANFPGGMGAEVGVYRRVSEDEEYSERFLFKKPVKEMDKGMHQFRNNLAKVPQKVKPLEKVVAALPRHDRPQGDPEGDVWYPFPELRTRLWFKLVNPLTREKFFQTTEQSTWWLTRWMAPDSYRNKYKKQHTVPAFPADFKLHYTINGKTYEAW